MSYFNEFLEKYSKYNDKFIKFILKRMLKLNLKYFIMILGQNINIDYI